MFQYACARSLAMRHGIDLLLDDWSGFIRDTQYRRQFELGALPIQGQLIKAWETWPMWLNRLNHRIWKPKRSFLEEHCYGRFIYETDYAWQQKLKNVELTRRTWIMGYWQSSNYFEDHASQIRSELMPPPSRQTNFLDIARIIRDSDSVALGVRLYEESNDPKSHTRDGKLKSKDQIRSAISSLIAKRPRSRFFVFCIHRSPILYDLDLPDDTIFLTHDDGYAGTLERLWLLSQCRHHIFTASSYYWWGAWLSMGVRGSEGQTIMASDNFMNRDGICPEWEIF